MNATELRNKVVELTTARSAPEIDNLYKESLRALLNIMGNLYHIDGNRNRIQVKCSHGNPERIVSRLRADNTLILPLMTLNETATANADDRRRTHSVIISEKAWDAKKRRATRVLYVAPRPVTLTYEINIWAKYKSDMDMLRSSIYSLFSPDMNVRTKFSDYNKAFISSERDTGSLVAGDTQDRIIKKSITISLETYLPSPKFQVTNTGEITPANFKAFVTVEGVEGNVTESTFRPPSPSPSPVVPVRVALNVIYVTLEDTVIGLEVGGEDVGNIEVVLTVNELSSNVNTDLGNVELSLKVNELSYIAITSIEKDLGNVELSLTVDEPSFNVTNDLGNVELSLTVDELSSNVTNDLGNVELILTVDEPSFNIDLYFSLPDNMVTPPDPINTTARRDLGNVEMNLTVNKLSYTVYNPVEKDLGIVEVRLTVNELSSIKVTSIEKDLGNVELSLEDTVLGIEVGGEDVGNIEVVLTVNTLSSTTISPINVRKDLGNVELSLEDTVIGIEVGGEDVGNIEVVLTVNTLAYIVV